MNRSYTCQSANLRTTSNKCRLNLVVSIDDTVIVTDIEYCPYFGRTYTPGVCRNVVRITRHGILTLLGSQ